MVDLAVVHLILFLVVALLVWEIDKLEQQLLYQIKDMMEVLVEILPLMVEELVVVPVVPVDQSHQLLEVMVDLAKQA